MENVALACAPFVASFLILWVGAWYCFKINKHPDDATLTTWMIFALGVDASLILYFTSQNHSIAKSITNITDSISVTSILIMLLVKRWGEKIKFSRNEKLCFVIAGIALVVWALTRTSWVGVVGFQVVMIVAYEPTLKKLWHWKPGNPPEPVETWGINAVAACIGVVIDVTGPHHDYVAMIYPSRGFICCIVVSIFILRWYRKNALHYANPA